jgi:hypothetical protein
MTIRASNGALCDFSADCTPALPALDHVPDIPPLFGRIAMIELQNNGIGFPAIHTRVFLKIAHYPFRKSLPLWRFVRLGLGDVVPGVARIMITNVLAATLSAVRLQATCGAISPVERRRIQDAAATWTGLAGCHPSHYPREASRRASHGGEKRQPDVTIARNTL